MTMRLDYTLYVLAAVFFIITAVAFVTLISTERSLWVVSTVVLGLLAIGLGYNYRPRVKTAPYKPTMTTTSPVKNETPTATTVSTTTTPETGTVEPAKMEVPMEQKVEATTEPAQMVEAPQTPLPAIEPQQTKEIQPVVETPQPMMETQPKAEPQLETKTETEAELKMEPQMEKTETDAQSSIDTVELVVPQSELTKVKGIGDKRAAQLKAIGINSLEDLAGASSVDVAWMLKISPKIVDKWVTGAQELVK
jgi:predicted flap endonuclease-1-like 5' DNA nuclease